VLLVDLLDSNPRTYFYTVHAVYARGSSYAEGAVDFPFWGHSGFNSGVLLLDLARLHDWGFAQRVQSILTGQQLANSTKLYNLGDQSVLNAVFAMGDGPEAVVELDTRWDYM
jgi:lipopolysaccharide biosynthesis glycosyltransferase